MIKNKLILFAIVFIFSCRQNVDEKKELKNTTWSEHIAGIVFINCTPCHRPGEAGGFSLLTYNDAFKRANLIRFVTRSRYMPPWPADPGYSHFINERFLKEEEIKLISDWVEQGAHRGDSTTEPKPPVNYKGSFFRKPDLVIYPPKPITIPGNGADAFMIVKYPYVIPNDTTVDFIEFVPHHRKRLHHVNGHLLSYDAKRKFNYLAGESIHNDERSEMMDIYRKMKIPYADNLKPEFPALTPNTVYYLPGYIPPVYPEEIGGYRIRKNGVFFLNNIHYGPGSEAIADSSYINVFYRTRPISRPVAESQLGTFGIAPVEPELVIPANEIKTFYTHTTLSKPISLLSVNPHMHLIGKSFVAFALKPNGDTIPLIRINKWDFRWQYYYTYKNPVILEKGSSIHVYGTFDNTNKNVNNPFHPPRTISQGNGNESMQTTEEMFQFIFNYLPYKKGDEKINLEGK